MKKIELTIDGRRVEVDPGTSLLAAARAAGARIPTLCEHEGLKPFGACRMCLVEIEKRGRRRLVASCAYLAEDGLSVTTENEKIRRLRRLIIELTWPAWSNQAREYGVESSRFETENKDCSLCGLCVRTCAEVKRKHAVYFEGRGIDRHVAFTPGLECECNSCRACFDLCTGGWLIEAAGRAYAGTAER